MFCEHNAQEDGTVMKFKKDFGQLMSVWLFCNSTYSPAISYVTTFMLSKAADNEAGGLCGWLFLNYCPFRYLCQGSLLASVTASTWSWGEKENCVTVIDLHNCGKFHFHILKLLIPLKIFVNVHVSGN